MPADTKQTVSARMGADTVYVTGTVNGKAVQWQKRSAGIWQTTVDKAENGVYAVSITAYDEFGRTTDYATTLRYGIYTITDRTLDDVLNKTSKGYYNAEDLNRVEFIVSVLAEQLKSYGYTVEVEPRRDWKMTDIPTVKDMDKYLDNVRKLRDAYYVLPDTPNVPENMIRLTYTEANDIEKILSVLYFLLENMKRSFLYCGELYCGEQ